MKIDNHSLSSTTERLGQTQADTTSDGPARSGSAGSAGDAVKVSSDAQLAATAASQVGPVGEDTVRPDVVERARAAVEAGTVGNDLDALADSLIDGLLDE